MGNRKAWIAVLALLLLTGCAYQTTCDAYSCTQEPAPIYKQPLFWILGPGEMVLFFAGFLVYLPFAMLGGWWTQRRARRDGMLR